MDLIGTDVDESSLLHVLQAEYRITVRVLSLLAERLAQATGQSRIEISFEALMDTPDLHAWRDNQRSAVMITTAR